MSTEPMSTTAAYDLWAQTYDSHDNPLVAMSDLALTELAPSLAGKRVLELGCGTGRLAPRVLAAGALTYTGVDGSQGMLTRARQLDDARASWRHADLTALPAELTGFDAVLLCLVLEHSREVTPVLAAAARALVPGGQLVALELHAELAERGVGAHFEHDGQTVQLASYPHDAAELRAACAHAGLTPTRITDWFPDERATARCRKLARYRGAPVLVELRASK